MDTLLLTIFVKPVEISLKFLNMAFDSLYYG